MSLRSSSLITVLCLVVSICCIELIEGNFILSNNTLPVPMYGHFAGALNDTLAVFAGKRGPSNTANTASYNSPIHSGLDNIQWNTVNLTLPLDITRLDEYESDCSVTVDDKVYIVNPFISGGTGTIYHQLFIYNMASHQFTVSVTPTHKTWGSCAVYNDETKILYVISGYMGGHLKYTQRFNVSSGQWIENGADTVIAVYHAGCSIDNANKKIFLFGGDVAATYSDEIQRYNVSDNSWTISSAALGVARIDPKCRSMTAHIYCMGGLSASAATLNIVDIFDPLTETMINTTYLNVARWQFTATVWNDGRCLIITGGVGLDSIETIGHCIAPTRTPTQYPTYHPTTNAPTTATDHPTAVPTANPTFEPTKNPTYEPTIDPTTDPTKHPMTSEPTSNPTSHEETAKSSTYNPTLLMIILCIIWIQCVNA